MEEDSPGPGRANREWKLECERLKAAMRKAADEVKWIHAHTAKPGEMRDRARLAIQFLEGR